MAVLEMSPSSAITTLPLTAETATQLLSCLDSLPPPGSTPAAPTVSLVATLVLHAAAPTRSGFILVAGDVSRPGSVRGCAVVMTDSVDPWISYVWASDTSLLRPMLSDIYNLVPVPKDPTTDRFHIYAVTKHFGPILDTLVVKGFCTIPYDKWILPHDAPLLGFAYDDIKLGAEWTDTDGKRFKIDLMRMQDVAQVAAASTTGTPEEYLHNIIAATDLHRTIRRIDNVAEGAFAPAVSWCMSHGDLSVGLLATDPDYRARGLARRCAASVTLAQREGVKFPCGRSYTLPAIAYIDPKNTASKITMGRIGFVNTEERLQWFGVKELVPLPTMDE
ncbi:hypothetical protein HDU86_008477 [Geranomyces michiganensis]|nr:hypothetical protein HDU86_008477 [Geranomyces michiganensis]